MERLSIIISTTELPGFRYKATYSSGNMALRHCRPRTRSRSIIRREPANLTSLAYTFSHIRSPANLTMGQETSRERSLRDQVRIHCDPQEFICR